MRKSVFLFDLDGTLLPMDQDRFVEGYFGLLAKKMAPHGYEPKKLIRSIWHGTAAMVTNDGRGANEEVFWEDMKTIYGPEVVRDVSLFEEFYANEFQQARALCGFQPRAAELVREIRAAGGRVVLATNPIFPAIATESRIRWAGLSPEDFEWYTTYENIGCCKPNPDYYRQILSRIGAGPEECVMIGNDADEDLAAAEVGIGVFLLTDDLINKKDRDLTDVPHGDFDALLGFVRAALYT